MSICLCVVCYNLITGIKRQVLSAEIYITFCGLDCIYIWFRSLNFDEDCSKFFFIPLYIVIMTLDNFSLASKTFRRPCPIFIQIEVYISVDYNILLLPAW